MSRRRTTEEERALFRATVSGQVQLKKLATSKVEKLKSAPMIARAASVPSGVDGHTDEKLRRGELSPDSRLDLHGLTEAVAHRVLTAHLHGAHLRGDRLVLVITGKGARAKPDAPFDLELAARARGVLARVVPRWLGEPQFARLIASTRSAHRRHGGEGALYVYLRKNRS
jgi:DNA-nicking Smr family endonuclease